MFHPLKSRFRLYLGKLEQEAHIATLYDFARSNRVAHALAVEEESTVYIEWSGVENQAPILFECQPGSPTTQILNTESPLPNGQGNGERCVEL